MDRALKDFDKRQRAVSMKHRRLAQGYVTRLNRNGTIEHRPIKRVPFVSVKALAMILAGFVGFKTLLVANLGPEDYAQRIAHLASGTTVERAGAWLMGQDPASLLLATQIHCLFG